MSESKPPMDGTEFYGISVQPYRWHPYNPKSEQFRRGISGRWQAMNEFGGWDNAKAPAHWIADDNNLARLIAAAPDLLSALDHLLTLFCDLAPLGENTEREVAVINARAAIAKATGQ